MSLLNEKAEGIRTEQPLLLRDGTSPLKLDNIKPGDEGNAVNQDILPILSNVPNRPCRYLTLGTQLDSSRSLPHQDKLPSMAANPITFNGTRKERADEATTIPKDTPTFKFVAEFKECKVGHYVVHWRVKLLQGFTIPSGFCFSVAVSYDDEPDTSGSFDTALGSDELKRLGMEHPHELDLHLKLEELVVIQPHEEKAKATVVLSLSNIESERPFEYSGLQVDFVEIRPYAENDEEQRTETTDQIQKHIVKRALKSEFTIDVTKTPETSEGKLSTIPITRLAFSKDSTFLAALALSKDIAYLTVWDMNSIGNQSEPNEISTFNRCAVATVKHDKDVDFRNFSIGLAVSPKGDQVAIYQEPRIGQWTNGAKLPMCSFRIRLFKNLLAWKSVPRVTPDSVSLTVVKEENTLAAQNIPHQRFDSFVGYGAFLTESEEWNDVNTVLFRSPDEVQIGSKSATQAGTNTAGNTLFVACNGIHIDVFKVAPEGGTWKHIHSITLTDLIPTFNRRIMCKMMMETINSNTFIWLEDNGLCCTLWDLRNGSNVSYMSSTNNAKFSGPNFRGSCKMAISPDESIVALAYDDTLTTYYASNGIEINARKYSGHKIEYIAFNGQSNQLFVVVRRTMSLKLSSRLIDPFQLNSQVKVSQVPIPIIGKTIFASFHEGKSRNKGVVYEADGSKIRCYVSHRPVDINVTDNVDNFVSSSYTSHPPLDKERQESVQGGFKDEHKEEGDEKPKRYTLRTKGHKQPFPNGGGLKYWVARVEVLEE
ncbi:hypothetical protein BGZ65_001608, partial [Modicella reniformis]